MPDSTNLVFPDSLVDFTPPDSGYPDILAARDTPENLSLMGARDFPDSLWIEPKDWMDVARERDKYETWPMNFRNRFTNQNPTHECTCHALTQCFESTYNSQQGSKDHPVLVSQISIYAEANPRQWGGAGCQQVLGISMRRGFLPEPIKGQDKLFKHTLHGTVGKGNSDNSSGPWVPLSRFPDGWQDTAMHLRPLEIINPKSWEELVCCILQGRAVGVGRSGHSIPYMQVVWRDGKLYIAYSDSYDIIRYDSLNMIRSAVGGSYVIWSTTTPADWSRPAGKDSPIALAA
jgi:hypothetical protein